MKKRGRKKERGKEKKRNIKIKPYFIDNKYHKQCTYVMLQV